MPSYQPGFSSSVRPETEMNAFFRRIFRRKKVEKSADKEKESLVTDTMPVSLAKTKEGKSKNRAKPTENASICIIGGGVSGLTAALTASKELNSKEKIILLESSGSMGGRVQSDTTIDGYTLDRGFAVFIENYPKARELLNYDALKLKKFLPGALVKLEDENELARVADPLRQPGELFTALFAPVGNFADKLALLLMIFDVNSKSIPDLFDEEESDTLSYLQSKWGLSDSMLDCFFKPFLEGIYLAPLEEQSSRMFSFVFKMFSEGAATLPQGGMGAVSKQLVETVEKLGVDIRLEHPVSRIHSTEDGFLVQTEDGKTAIQAKTVIIATDGHIAQKIVSQLEGFETLEESPEQPQRSVGCLYYGFEGTPPVTDPILILNGIGQRRGDKANPVNNVCFPSVVNEGYAPEGYSLCSATVLKGAMDAYKGREDELDDAVRKQLATWFPGYEYDIMKKWELKRIYKIPNAQPGQLKGPFPANVNGGRDCTTFRGMGLPKGLFLCGDHMATATLNGALESGANAGIAAAKLFS